MSVLSLPFLKQISHPWNCVMPSEYSDPSDWSGHAQNVDTPHGENHLISQEMVFLMTIQKKVIGYRTESN